ncbi:MAG: DUF3786 domain-containing protein [Thermodesulfovibrionales bacterium]
MNCLDIYKALPKTNCGDCGLATCMSFSLSVFRGERSVGDCPHISSDIAETLSSEVVRVDWKSELVEALSLEISNIDLRAIAPRIGAEMVGDKLRIRCLGADFFIGCGGEVSSRGYLNQWIKILLLHYVRTGGPSELSGQWVSFSELKGGLVKGSSFVRECEEPLKTIIDADVPRFDRTVSLLGGRTTSEGSAQKAWILHPLPKIPFLILYWPQDSEFDSELKILFDRSADRFLDVEALVFLGEGLIATIRAVGPTAPSAPQ